MKSTGTGKVIPTDRQVIRKAFFVSMIEEISSNSLSATKPIFFLSLEPNEGLHIPNLDKRFKIKSGSECLLEFGKGVKDKRTSEPGVVLEVKAIEIKGMNANVYGGYFAGAGVLYTFRLKRIQNDYS